MLIVTHFLDKGGIEEVIRGYASCIDRNRFELRVACVQGGVVSSEIERIPDVQIHYLDTSTRWRKLASLWNISRTYRPHVVHNHFCWYGLVAGFLVGAYRVETIHNTYSWLRGAPRIAYGLYCLLAHRLIAVSEAVQEFSKGYFPLLKGREISIIHNGIQTARFAGGSRSRGLRRSLGIPPTGLVIGFVGRFEEQKGLTFLLHAASRLERTHKRLRVILVGGGSLESRLRAEADRLGVRRVMFLPYRRDIPSVLKTFDIFVLPSLFEGLPLSVLEAMASGKAVVATRVGGVPEAVVEGATGFLVEPRNAGQLADCLERLLTDSRLRRAMGERGRERAISLFSVEAMVSKTEDIYAELAGIPQPSPARPNVRPVPARKGKEHR